MTLPFLLYSIVKMGPQPTTFFSGTAAGACAVRVGAGGAFSSDQSKDSACLLSPFLKRLRKESRTPGCFSSAFGPAGATGAGGWATGIGGSST